MTKHIMQSRFSNVQLEILQLFTEDLPEEDLLVIRDMLSAYRFKRASEAASKATKAKGWTADDFEKLLHTQQFSTGHGDYTKDRDLLFKEKSLMDIMNEIKKQRES